MKSTDEYLQYHKLRYDTTTDLNNIRLTESWTKDCMKMIAEAIWRIFSCISMNNIVIKKPRLTFNNFSMQSCISLIELNCIVHQSQSFDFSFYKISC